jgi:polyhydroxyalkanoate synthesis regulator phasin
MKKILSTFLLLAITATSLTFFSACGDKLGANYDAGTPTSYITLNINPAIEIVADDKNKVIAVNSINDEGQLAFYSKNYRGYSVDVAVREMTKELAKTGYINASSEQETEALFVSVYSISGSTQTEVYSKIRSTVNSFFKNNGLYAVVAETKFNYEISRHATENSIDNEHKFRAMLKTMEYDADFSITDAIDLSSQKLINKIYNQVALISEIPTRDKKQAYLDEKLILKESLQADIVTTFDDAEYTTLYNQLQTLKEQYRSADLSETEAIKEDITALEVQIAPIYEELKQENETAFNFLKGIYNDNLNQLTNLYTQQVTGEVNFENLYQSRLQENSALFEQRREYATNNNFGLEYSEWQPIGETQMSAFLSEISAQVNNVENQTQQEVQRALDRINPYNKSFGLSDGQTESWTLPF